MGATTMRLGKVSGPRGEFSVMGEKSRLMVLCCQSKNTILRPDQESSGKAVAKKTTLVGSLFLSHQLVPEAGIEPARCFAPADFESAASTNFATPAEKDSNYGTVWV